MDAQNIFWRLPWPVVAMVTSLTAWKAEDPRLLKTNQHPEYTMEKRVELRQLDSYMWKNEIGLFTNTTYKKSQNGLKT